MLAGGRGSVGGTRGSRHPEYTVSAEESGRVAMSEGFEATSRDSDQVHPGFHKYYWHSVDCRRVKSYPNVCHPKRTTSPAVPRSITSCVTSHTDPISALLHVVRAEQTPVVVRPGFCFLVDKLPSDYRILSGIVGPVLAVQGCPQVPRTITHSSTDPVCLRL